jgi:ectoine hydroxylase-related dioxygenase (phytanoyl-CoA dioxygenase family)
MAAAEFPHEAYAVTAEQVQSLARDGAVCVRALLSQDWRDRLSILFEQLKDQGTDLSSYYGDAESGAPGAGRGQTVVRNDCWRLNPEFLRFLQASPLAASAAALLNSRQVRLFEDLLIYKSPGAEQSTPWHQDEPQWPVSGRQMVSGWFCLDAVTTNTGALRFILGSHRGPLYRPVVPPDRHADAVADAGYFDGGALPDVDADPKRFPIRAFDVTPGDVVFFHPRVLHGAFGSAPTHPRRTFSVRFLGDDVRWLPKRSVFHDWMKEIPLGEGDIVSGERFPLLWPPCRDPAFPTRAE